MDPSDSNPPSTSPALLPIDTTPAATSLAAVVQTASATPPQAALLLEEFEQSKLEAERLRQVKQAEAVRRQEEEVFEKARTLKQTLEKEQAQKLAQEAEEKWKEEERRQQQLKKQGEALSKFEDEQRLKASMTQAEWEAFINSKEQAMRAATAAALLEEQKRAAMVNIERIKTEELARQERLLSGMGIDLSSATDEKISTTTPSLPPSAAATTPTTNISHQEDDENEPLALASTKKSPMLPPALNTSPLRTKQHLAVAGADIRSELNIQSPMDPIVSLKHEAPSPVIRQEFDIQSPIVSSVAGAAQPALPPQQKSGIVIPLSKLRNDSNEDRDLPPLTPVIRSEFNIQSPLPDQDIPFIRMDNAVTLKQDFLRMMEEEEKRSREMTGIAEAPSGDLPSEVMGKYAPVVDAGFVRHRRSKLPNSHHSTSNNGMDDLGCQCVIL